jgi:CRP/FNR family cyclic AMP-dependent transcriptional regulator
VEDSRLLTRYTHRQLASMIGANREATTRALRTLRERGVLEVKNRYIHVADLEGLRRLAHEA